MLPKEQIESIKQQLLKQVSNFPPDKRASAEREIKEMNDEELEEFLIQNNLIKADGKGSKDNEQCIFCSIAEGKISSFKIANDNEAVAVLEINPISKGHVIVIPKTHISNEKEIPKSVFSFAEKVEKKLSEKLKPKKILIKTSSVLGHSIINLIPVYSEETLDSPRKKADEAELMELQKLLEIKAVKEKKKTIRVPKPKIIKEKIYIPRRIP